MKIRNLVVAILTFLLMSGIGFAQVNIEGPETHGALSPVTGANIQQGQTQSNHNNILNVDTNVFAPRNSDEQEQNQRQRQNQGQLQGQKMDQFGYVAPIQTTTFISPRDLLSAPGATPSEIQILPGKMWKMSANDIPNIGIKAYAGEEYAAVESFNGSLINRVRDEDLAEDLLTFRNRVLKKKGWTKDKVRLVVNVRDAGETNSTSGSAAGAYSGNITPASAASSTLGLFPGKSRWKADYQYNPVFYLLLK